MSKVITWVFVAVLIIGGFVSLDLLPKTWFDRFPAWGQIALVTWVIVFSVVMVLGYVFDSGLLQRIFKRKPP